MAGKVVAPNHFQPDYLKLTNQFFLVLGKTKYLFGQKKLKNLYIYVNYVYNVLYIIYNVYINIERAVMLSACFI